MLDSYSDERGRDALAFEPLPKRRWINALPGNNHLLIMLQPHARITPMLMALDGTAPETWRKPFAQGIVHVSYKVPWRHAEAVRALIPKIDAILAADDAARTAKNAAITADARHQVEVHLAAAIREAASGERSAHAYWEALSAAVIPMPAPSPYHDITQWERRFLTPFCERFWARQEVPRLTEAQQRIADEVYNKIKHYVVL